MKRYFKLVKLLDSGKIDIKDFIKKVSGDDIITEITATSTYWIYVEDGGKKYSIDDFIKAVEQNILPSNIDVKNLTFRAMNKWGLK